MSRKVTPPFNGEQPHIGEADAVDFYHGRVSVKRMHEINDHLDHCPTCDDFYAAVRAREGAA